MGSKGGSAGFLYGDLELIWNQSYIGPDRRYRFRRFSGSSRSGLERRSRTAPKHILDMRKNSDRRTSRTRRNCQDHRLEYLSPPPLLARLIE